MGRKVKPIIAAILLATACAEPREDCLEVCREHVAPELLRQFAPGWGKCVECNWEEVEK